MDNDNARFLLLGIVIAIFVPQMVTLMCLKKDGRSISADVSTTQTRDCGKDQIFVNGKCTCTNSKKIHDGNACVCDSAHVDDGNNGCICAPGYILDGTDCVPGKRSLGKEEIKIEQDFMKKYFKGGKSFEQSTTETQDDEDVPGTQPAFGHYKQVGYTDMEEIFLANEQASLNTNKVLPFIGKSKARPLSKRYENININRTEADAVNPESESTLHYGIDSRDSAVEYAINSMGMSVNYPHTQLTDFANGDVMTGFQPINSIHRPFVLSEMVYKLPETKNQRVLNGEAEGWKGASHTVPLEIRHADKLKDIEGQVPYPIPVESKETALYWQSEIPKREPRGVEELNVWQVGNPIMKVQSDVVPRGTEFRNSREPYKPDRVNHGFHGQYLNPLDNVTNLQKASYAGTDFEIDHVHPLPRQPAPNIDNLAIRNMEIVRGTSNKVYDNSTDTHPSRQYDDRNTLAMPKRDQSINQGRQMDSLAPYDLSHFQYSPDSMMLDRNEILAGPGVFTGVA